MFLKISSQLKNISEVFDADMHNIHVAFSHFIPHIAPMNRNFFDGVPGSFSADEKLGIKKPGIVLDIIKKGFDDFGVDRFKTAGCILEFGTKQHPNQEVVDS